MSKWYSNFLHTSKIYNVTQTFFSNLNKFRMFQNMSNILYLVLHTFYFSLLHFLQSKKLNAFGQLESLITSRNFLAIHAVSLCKKFRIVILNLICPFPFHYIRTRLNVWIFNLVNLILIGNYFISRMWPVSH